MIKTSGLFDVMMYNLQAGLTYTGLWMSEQDK